MCSQQSKFLVLYLSVTSMRTQSFEDTSQHQPTLMKHHSIVSSSMPQVWSWPCSSSSRTSSGFILHTSLFQRGFHPHSHIHPCLEVVHHIQVLHLELGSKSPSCNFNELLFSVRNKSLTYNGSITGLPPQTLKQRLEYTLLSLNPRAISNFSILSYHVKPRDLLQSLPLKRSIILPLPFVLYVLKHFVLE